MKDVRTEVAKVREWMKTHIEPNTGVCAKMSWLCLQVESLMTENERLRAKGLEGDAKAKLEEIENRVNLYRLDYDMPDDPGDVLAEDDMRWLLSIVESLRAQLETAR